MEIYCIIYEIKHLDLSDLTGRVNIYILHRSKYEEMIQIMHASARNNPAASVYLCE